jgi:tetratricopeptide (TPR) repeat protein
MGADTALVARLLERAQCGEADEVLRLSETILREPTGDLADGDAGMHFVRSVALVAQRRTDEALGATELMLRSAEREGSEGWRSCALSLRAWEQLLLDEHTADLEVDAVLQDLVDAEAALENSAEDSVIAENAHTGVGLAYHHLRLYELALPHYEAAYAVSAQDGRQAGNQAMWQGNMAWLHLEWALELARVHLGAEARQHNLEAGVHAALAIDLASGPDAERWREHASLLGGCAAADGPDPATAARSIERYSVMLANRGVHREAAYAQPFLARALSRSGDPERAGEVIERAAADLPTDAGWLTVAALHHTRLTLLATDGDPVIAAALAYGDSLALALWRQRQRTLHTATTLKSYDRLRDEHERMAHTAETDALTTLANRRAFDNAVESIKASGDDRRLAALLIDLDTLGSVAMSSPRCCTAPTPSRRTPWHNGWSRRSTPSRPGASPSASGSPAAPPTTSRRCWPPPTRRCTSPNGQVATELTPTVLATRGRATPHPMPTPTRRHARRSLFRELAGKTVQRQGTVVAGHARHQIIATDREARRARRRGQWRSASTASTSSQPETSPTSKPPKLSVVNPWAQPPR